MEEVEEVSDKMTKADDDEGTKTIEIDVGIVVRRLGLTSSPSRDHNRGPLTGRRRDITSRLLQHFHYPHKRFRHPLQTQL